MPYTNPKAVLIRATRSPWRRYGAAVLSVVLAAAVRCGIVLAGGHDSNPYLLFGIAVVIAAWYGGLGPGLLATVLATVTVDIILVQFGMTDLNLTDHLLDVALFLALGTIVSWLGHSNRETTAGLQNLYRQMETRVIERTRELSAVNAALIDEATAREEQQVQLAALNAQLEQSNRELQDFASVASHDLQEPLRKIQAFGDRLAHRYGEQLEGPGRDYLDRMQKAAGRMQILINDLLTFSRVASKAMPFVEVDFNQIAAEVVSDLEMRIEETGGRVELEPLPRIYADPLQMRQLLQNLIANGLKFARPDVPPVVRVSAETAAVAAANGNEDAAREMVAIHVADNGIGFDEKYLDRIFNVFQRLHGRHAYEGTGIGLAVCRKIAARHGGDVTAHSRMGHGATFVVTLPVHHAEGTLDDAGSAQADHHPAGG